MEPKRSVPTASDGRPTGVAVGLDIGTSGARALVATVTGKVLGEGEAAYPLAAAHPGEAEQDPHDWWRGAITAVRAALAASDVSSVDAIGLTGQMHGVVLLDEILEPRRPALLWCDSRAGGDADEVTRAYGRQNLIARAGNLPMAGFTAPQLRWLDRVGALTGTRWVVSAKDFVRARLTGAVATDPSDASGTGLLGLDGRWDDDLIDAYGVDRAMLPPLLPSAACAGTLTREAAAELGLAPGTPVATGAADNAAAALGGGVVAPGGMLVSLGTSGTLVVPVSQPLPDPTGSCHTFCHAVEGRWYSMAVVLNAGGAFAWWRSVTGLSMEELGAAAATAGPGSAGVVMLPFLSGRRMPVLDPEARAAFWGMSLAHDLGHLTRAVIEGAGFAMADGLDCIRALGLDATDAVLTGGAADHPIWREALGLALPGLRLTSASPAGGAALGAAFLGLAAAGEPLEDLVDRVVSREPIARPLIDERERAALRASRERYRALAASTSRVPRKEPAS